MAAGVAIYTASAHRSLMQRGCQSSAPLLQKKGNTKWRDASSKLSASSKENLLGECHRKGSISGITVSKYCLTRRVQPQDHSLHLHSLCCHPKDYSGWPKNSVLLPCPVPHRYTMGKDSATAFAQEDKALQHTMLAWLQDPCIQSPGARETPQAGG